MLRTVLAVALASALLAVSLPVVDTARTTHAERTVETALRRLDATATALTDGNDPVGPGLDGARRVHALTLPRESWGTAALDALRFPPPGGEGGLSWRVSGGDWTTFHPSVPVVAPPDGLTLAEGGRQRLVLELQRRDGRAVVAAHRPDV